MQWFKNLDATPRLLISFGALILLMVGICLLAIDKLGEANRHMTELYQDDMMGAIRIDNTIIDRFSLDRSTREAMLSIDKAEIVAADEKSMLAAFADLHANLDAAQKSFDSQEGIALLAGLQGILPGYEKGYHDIFRLIDARDLEGAKAAMGNVDNNQGVLFIAAADKAKALNQGLVNEKFQLTTGTYESTRAIIFAATILAIVVGVVLALLVARTISGPLALTVSALERLAGGDLTVSVAVDTKDELGRMALALNDAVDKLRATLQGVNENAASVSAGSQELAAAADAIASGAQEQAASLEETSASLEQITATVRHSADNAKQASQLASGSRDAAERGIEVVVHAITAMEEINAASAKISDIISTIDEIAFQTNLLAVNAAVEAARAGEEGRGFAVVATEVRSLAQRSAGAAKEIKTLIHDSLRKVEKGSELVNKSGETLRSIVGSVKGVTDIVNESAAAAAEQSTGVEQVNTAMTQMDRVTQSNAAQTEQLSSTAQALSEQSQRLMELVGTFVLDRDGTRSRGANSAKRSPTVIQHAPHARPRPRQPYAAGMQPTPKRDVAIAVAASGKENALFEEF